MPPRTVEVIDLQDDSESDSDDEDDIILVKPVEVQVFYQFSLYYLVNTSLVLFLLYVAFHLYWFFSR